MKILGKWKLYDFGAEYPNAVIPLNRWIASVEEANWKKAADVQSTWQHSRILSKNEILFNIGGNNFRLFALVVFEEGKVTVDWIKTHKDYDKWNKKR